MAVEENWVCVQCKPSKEAFANVNFLAQGFETFLPYVSEYKLRNGKMTWVKSVMFKRYLFVKCNPDTNFTTIRSTLGVANYIQFNGEPALIPVSEIQRIQAICDEANCYQIVAENFEEGDEVEIVTGPYQGLAAIFKTYSSADQRVILLMEFMEGISVPTEIALDEIRRLDSD
ncbi:MAG: hypothetical protein MK193_00925 [Lentisphaeria bacterium]|nr:hypothetical protein [Lentisphaeria bacterium]